MQQEAIELKLSVQPQESYEIEIGEVNSLDLGQLEGNDIDLVFVFYEITKASDASLTYDFKVDHSYDKGLITLEIDLTKIDPELAGSSVIGELSIWNMVQQSAISEMEFILICTNKDKCKK